MNSLKRLFIVIVLVFAGQSAMAAEAEAGGMFSLTLNKEFNEYFSANIQNHLYDIKILSIFASSNRKKT